MISKWKTIWFRMLGFASIFLLTAGLVLAQAEDRPSLVPAQPVQAGGDPSLHPTRPLYVTGQVVMSNGEALPERVVIERACSVSGARKEGYTDEEGRFSLQLGMNRGILADPSGLGGNRSPSVMTSSPLDNAPTDTRFWNCELRANLPGYLSSTISLAGRRYFDEPDVGVIVLSPFGKVKGLSVSATSDLAPNNSRRAFERGMEALGDDDLEDAEKSFQTAVQIYARHAEAWYQLGRLYQQRDEPDQARAAFLKVVEADSNYVYPYEGLYQLAFERDDMEDLLDKTEALLRLNPYEFPQAFYYSAVANLQLKHYETGEERIRTAIEMDPGYSQPMEFYLLGFLLTGEGKLTEALGAFDIFLVLQPTGNPAKEAHAARKKIQRRLESQLYLIPAKPWWAPARPVD